jgi:putative glutamine amidotransferase
LANFTEPRYHPVQVDSNSQLFSLLEIASGEVTSIHHQSIERIAEGLVTNTITADGVIEGVEWLHPQGKVPMILVQWHPEAMHDKGSPFAKNIREYFVKLVKDNS